MRRRVSPLGSCDCHVHLFDPVRFPYAASRSYTPGSTSVAQLLDFEGRLGVDRVVLVQPSVYGSDNSALLAGLLDLGPARARGVAVVDPKVVNREKLDVLHEAGVRSIRVNLATHQERDLSVALGQLQRAADVVGPLGWSVQLFADLDVIAALARPVVALGVPVVLDHFMGVRDAGNPEQQTLRDAAVELVRSGCVYVKLSAPYRVSQQPSYFDLDAFARRLIQARPDRMLWASDWPHTGSASERDGDLGKIEAFRVFDDALALERVLAWAGTDDVRHQIMVENPAALYGFAVMPGQVSKAQ